ncbi:hypothetical protein D3C76_1383730 [compost metagenome]
MIAKIDVFAHQVVEIPHLIIDLIVPAVAGVVIHDFEDAVFVGVFNVIDAAEAFVIPDKLGILPGANREGVPRPGLTFDHLVVNLRSILLIHPLHADRLFLICAHFVVHHHVQQYGDLIAF